MPPRRTITSRGFTLLEVLVASVVLTLGLILTLQSITAGLAAAGRTARLAEARAVAADMLNRAAAGAEPIPASGDETRGVIVYSWRLAWDSQIAHARQAVCRVEWDYRRRRQSLSLSRLIAPDRQGGP